MTVKVIKDWMGFQNAIHGEKPAIIECGPCKSMAPLFAELSDDPAHSSLDFFVCDIDVNEQAAQEVGIRTVPAFMVFKEMTKLEEVMGAQPAALKRLVETHAKA
ncbi:hypothetical protein NBRC10512v2_007465 [Rhodotorula toruloides]|uniref:Thioredoxin n=1 Tax=Rhodotorula toruloides (strain NP11) TaxID=1130832 RepID=M7XGZ3_RHOT1|nr:thioredoxin [Rhodotorula toruloides NP11]EMS23144.1 thioredoxin [Rhodotorula toruloides NP11]